MRSSVRGGTAYFARFAVTALLLVGGTLVLVLVVLPRRYVLDYSFREAAVNLPEAAVPFEPLRPLLVTAEAAVPERREVVERVTVAAPTAPSTAGEEGGAPDAPAAPTPPQPGPAELFWADVLPMLEAGRYAEAVFVFQRYVGEHPDDRGARRELAITLTAAGRPGAAVPILEGLLATEEDPETRLLLARTLRDMGRTDDALGSYRVLLARNPGDETLSLELGRALAWVERWDEARSVLRAALEGHPSSQPLRAELARVSYSAGDVEQARSLLMSLYREPVLVGEAGEVVADLRTSMTADSLAEAARAPRPTLVEQGLAAREAGDHQEARRLFLAALAERPDDSSAWLAYANLLEYELADLAGAREALTEVERLGAGTPALSYRIAQLEVWDGRTAEARTRLQALLDEEPEAGASSDQTPDAASGSPSRADVIALLGDLDRWQGDRSGAARRYESALSEEPENERATEGLATLHEEVDAEIRAVERPGLGSAARALADTDDFGRYDVAGRWSGLRDGWVWSGALGQRWVEGSGFTGLEERVGGAFLELSPARWWRWGTIRTSLSVGAQWLRPGEQDVSVAGAVRFRRSDGGTLDVELAHEPSLETTVTLQSTLADVTQTRVTAELSRPLGERWAIAVRGDAAGLSSPDEGSSSVARLQGAATVARTVSESTVLGVRAAALTYSGPAPTPSGVRLFWDPSLAVSLGPLGRFSATQGARWTASLSVNPGLALIDERDDRGLQAVPQLAADAGITWSGSKIDARLGVFYAQARVEGYRSYGATLSLSTGGRAGTR